MDPSRVDCQSNPPRINIVRGNPSKVLMDPSQVNCQLTPPPLCSLPSYKFQPLCRSFSSWLSIEPPSTPQLQISTSLQILPNLTVDHPLPLPSLPTYKFQPLCRSFPSWLSIDPAPHRSLPTYKWQPLSLLSIDPPSVLIWGQSTDFEQNSSHSNQTTCLASQRTFP